MNPTGLEARGASSAEESRSLKVEVVEQYRDWAPQLPAKHIVELFLAETPNRFLLGLSRVVLTNSQVLNHKERRRKTRRKGRKVRLATALGLYYQRWHGRPAYIELFVDNIEASVKPVTLILYRLRLLSAFLFGLTLFHEVGHHVHATQKPEHREREDVADDWSGRLLRNYLQQRHRVFVYSYWRLSRVVGWWRGLFARMSRQTSVG